MGEYKYKLKDIVAGEYVESNDNVLFWTEVYQRMSEYKDKYGSNKIDAYKEENMYIIREVH